MRHNKLRTFLTGTAVTWGIFMLIVLLGVSNGLINSFNDGFMAAGNDKVSVYGGFTTKPYRGYAEGRQIDLKTPDGPKIKQDNSTHVADVSYVIENNEAKISTQNEFITGFVGASPDYASSRGLTLMQGRFITQADMSQLRKVIVLEADKARTLFGESDSYVNKQVILNGFVFTVVGVYHHEWNKTSVIPFTVAKKMTGDSEEVSGIVVKVKNLKTAEDGTQLEGDILKSLSGPHEFDPSDKGALFIWNSFIRYIQSVNGLNMLNMAVWVICILSMLTGIVGVSNIMFVSVKERTHEIGIRRAIGATPRNVLTQILSESVFMTTLFGYIGIVLGSVALAGLSQVFADGKYIKDPNVDLSIACYVTILLIIAGSLAGLFPALKALKIKPVEALREE